MSQLTAIEELQLAHDRHIKKLQEINETLLADLKSQLQRSRKEVTDLEKDKIELGEVVEGMRTEVEVLRQSFELVQAQLSRVLVYQDDLVKLVRLIDDEDRNKRSIPNGFTGHHCNITEIESHLKAQDKEDVSVTASLLALKYFKKLESSEPLHLSHLLEIPFCQDRSFALSASLLTSISGHMAADNGTAQKFERFPMYPVLLNEISRLRQEVNELSRLHLITNSTPKLEKKLADKSYKNTVAQCLIEEGNTNDNTNTNVMNMSAILTSLLSNFK